jgi:hypothetical protein
MLRGVENIFAAFMEITRTATLINKRPPLGGRNRQVRNLALGAGAFIRRIYMRLMFVNHHY